MNLVYKLYNKKSLLKEYHILLIRTFKMPTQFAENLLISGHGQRSHIVMQLVCKAVCDG